MKVKKYKSDRLVTINIQKYKIDWNSAPSKGQQVLQNFLYPYWRNSLILQEMYVPGTKWRFDLVNCNRKIIVEYSPKTHHGNFNKFFHRSRAGYLRSIKADLFKYDWAIENDFKVAEIVEKDLDNLSIKFFQDKFNISII